MKDFELNEYDLAVAPLLDEVLPDRLFDAHMHLTLPGTQYGPPSFDAYLADLAPLVGGRHLRSNGIMRPSAEMKDPALRSLAEENLLKELDRHPENVGEVLVLPQDDEAAIEARLLHPRIRGLKCYHVYASRADTPYAAPGEYLPRAAWEVADRHGLAITLHLVKDEALSHPDNLSYVKRMTAEYKNARLVLAHGARAFAPRTVYSALDELCDRPNVYYDFSALCEPTAMLYILQRVGVGRCMFGTDYPIAMLGGKAVSLGSSFAWLSCSDYERILGKDHRGLHVITEELLAMRDLVILAGLTPLEREALFYGTAADLFCAEKAL